MSNVCIGHTDISRDLDRCLFVFVLSVLFVDYYGIYTFIYVLTQQTLLSCYLTRGALLIVTFSEILLIFRKSTILY